MLVEKFPPCEIRSAAEHRKYLELIKVLMRELGSGCAGPMAEGMRRYLSVLTPFVRRFERSHWPSARATGTEALAFLMEQNGLKQGDLREEIGKQPYVSDILNGKKNLTAEQIQRLSKRFGVSPAVFFD